MLSVALTPSSTKRLSSVVTVTPKPTELDPFKHLANDVKRGQVLDAEAEAEAERSMPRQRTRPKCWPRGQSIPTLQRHTDTLNTRSKQSPRSAEN